MSSELRIIEEAIKIILRDKRPHDTVEKELLIFHLKSVEEILEKYNKEIEMLRQWKDD